MEKANARWRNTRVSWSQAQKKKHKKQPDAANQAASFEFPYANYKKKR